MAGLDDMRRQLDAKARRAGQVLASEWERELRDDSPVDTGNMREKTTVSARASARGIVVEAVVDTAYAEMVAGGVRPHVIVPRTAGVLRFVASSGDVVYAPRVEHPGQQPNPWWDDSIRRLPDLVQRVWRGVR